jgi:ferric-dicitrate binding protein FerR (iron transport regulator)
MNMNELITKYLSKESTPEENNALLEWVISSEDNKKEFITYCQYWYNTANKKEEAKIDSQKAFNSFLNKTKDLNQEKTTSKETKKISLWQSISAVAAVAILTLGAFFLFNNQGSEIEMASFSNNKNTISELALPDGSIVYLHKGATLEYPKAFASDNRTIEANGHFYIEVTPNKEAPFIINSEDISIEVLGTAFDVNTNQEESDVIVSHGKVLVSSGNQSVVLEKGERADYDVTGLLKSENNDINFLSWQTGILSFEATSLKQVFSDIERHYGCTINVTSEDIYSEKMTGTYQDYEIEDIITIISSTFPSLEFAQEGNIYTVSK